MKIVSGGMEAASLDRAEESQLNVSPTLNPAGSNAGAAEARPGRLRSENPSLPPPQIVRALRDALAPTQNGPTWKTPYGVCLLYTSPSPRDS